MSRTKKTEWTPGPEFQAACERTLATAHGCAAAVLQEPAVEEPEKNASHTALTMAMGMVYFLTRLDTNDVMALHAQKGGLGAVPLRPVRGIGGSLAR